MEKYFWQIMFHFTNKHSERETDHVVFAFHLHVPCSETVLASRLVLLVILVFVLLFFLYLSCFFSSYLSSWWLWSRFPEGEDCKMKLIRSPFQRCRGRDSSGQRSFRCGRSRCWNTFQTTLKRDTMRPSNGDFFSFIGEQTWNDRICKCFTRARL